MYLYFIFWRTEISISSSFMELEQVGFDNMLSPHLIISKGNSYPGFPGESQFMLVILY